MRKLKSAAIAVGLVVLAALGAPQVLQPSTLHLAQAIKELGPISGWRCVQSATYVYDPRSDRADSTLLSDPPEAGLSGVVAERVEANLRGGDAVIWTRVASDDVGGGERRVYVLSPGRLQTLSADGPDGRRTTLCNTHLGDWSIVAEHALG